MFQTSLTGQLPVLSLPPVVNRKGYSPECFSSVSQNQLLSALCVSIFNFLWMNNNYCIYVKKKKKIMLQKITKHQKIIKNTKWTKTK